jgi:hypothetical protein
MKFNPRTRTQVKDTNRTQGIANPRTRTGRPQAARPTATSTGQQHTSLYDLSDMMRDLERTSRLNTQVRRRKGNPMHKHPTDAKHRTVPTAPPYCTAAASTARHDRAINSTPLRRHSSRPRQSRRDHSRQDHAQASASSPCACRPCSSL